MPAVVTGDGGASGKKLKLTKNQIKRARKKEKKIESQSKPTSTAAEPKATPTPPIVSLSPDLELFRLISPVQNVTEKKADSPVNDDFEVDESEAEDPLYADFKDIFKKFEAEEESSEAAAERKGEVFYDDDDDIPDEDEDAETAEPKVSKKARKLLNKLSVAELKALVQKPDLVDWTDTSASDPRLLVHIKSYRNVVPVPTHWSLKREYLSSKRGVEKPPFSLPKFIQETGIAEMRDAVLEKQDQASLKQKQRERVQPKMGKLDIDYQKLYEAFFRFQTKPELTRYGEVYYEGKEYETNLRHLRPGDLSEELKEALNIPPGAPPPWLINQQRYGPPPSYPAMKIPGLNAPPPPGGQWGYHAGGYGKPPVDEYNRPLFGGDIFGVLQQQANTQLGEPVEKTLWGELQEPEEESEEEESDDEEEDEDETGAGLQTPSGLDTPSGMTSAMPSEFGGEVSVSGDFDLRKQKRGTETEESSHPRSLYTVLPEQQIKSKGFFGGERAYDVKGAHNSSLPTLDGDDQGRKRKKPGDVDVAIDLDSIQAQDGLSKDEVRKQFDVQKSEEQGRWGIQEDLSDMIATESRKRIKRDEQNRTRTTIEVDIHQMNLTGDLSIILVRPLVAMGFVLDVHHPEIVDLIGLVGLLPGAQIDAREHARDLLCEDGLLDVMRLVGMSARGPDPHVDRADPNAQDPHPDVAETLALDFEDVTTDRDLLRLSKQALRKIVTTGVPAPPEMIDETTSKGGSGALAHLHLDRVTSASMTAIVPRPVTTLAETPAIRLVSLRLQFIQAEYHFSPATIRGIDPLGPLLLGLVAGALDLLFTRHNIQDPCHRKKAPLGGQTIGEQDRHLYPMRDRSPPQKRVDDYPRNDGPQDRKQSCFDATPERGPRANGFSQSLSREPPTGPSRRYDSPVSTPPTGPATSVPVSSAPPPRSGNVNLLSAPREPRGGGGGRVIIPRRESHHNGPPPEFRRGGPSGYSRGPRPSFGGPPMFRSNNSSSTTYPRSQRFNNPLNDLPRILPGGKTNPAFDVSDKLKKLEADKQKLEEVLAEKETKKRAALRDWDRLERDSMRETLRAELADEQIKTLSGEGGSGGSAF
ncbi:MAG: hypothetical protein M1814_002431 [Vezdaea aestivalis]|nr:MAG: hypothetical protein M1814_002431 [Vezdaea aestivalis]